MDTRHRRELRSRGVDRYRTMMPRAPPPLPSLLGPHLFPSMSLGIFRTPPPRNEPVLGYAPGSPEKKRLQDELARQAAEVVEIPLVIGGQDVRGARTVDVVMPHDKRHVLGKVHMAGAREVTLAIDAATKARAAWQAFSWEERAAVFLRAAELLAGPWRERINAATMLNQSKTCHQAEID